MGHSGKLCAFPSRALPDSNPALSITSQLWRPPKEGEGEGLDAGGLPPNGLSCLEDPMRRAIQVRAVAALEPQFSTWPPAALSEGDVQGQV